MGNIFGEVPAYTTIGYWAQELGLSVYKESCTLFKGKRYALIVDESMMIGSEKMLLTLAVAADNIRMAITEKDIKNNGWSQVSIARCKKLVTESLMLRNERQRKVGSYILGYLEREFSLLNEGDVHNASSATIESTFGVPNGVFLHRGLFCCYFFFFFLKKT